MIAALFVAPRGVYYGLPDVDPWDEQRDARNYAGPWSVVAHPPCNVWCGYTGLNWSRYGGEHNRPGNDAGCFASALASVRQWGGVLEHPAYSRAWPVFGLTRPSRHGGWTPTDCGGWVCHVEQAHYGHRARKATWLYAAGGLPLVQLRWGPAKAEAWCTPGTTIENARGRTDVVPMPKRERQATPAPFRDLLLAIAASASKAAA